MVVTRNGMGSRSKLVCSFGVGFNIHVDLFDFITEVSIDVGTSLGPVGGPLGGVGIDPNMTRDAYSFLPTWLHPR